MTILDERPAVLESAAERGTGGEAPHTAEAAPPREVGRGRNPMTLVRVTRGCAVVITTVIGVASFILSFASLCDLARRSGVPDRLAWLWPVVVDGTILQATMAIVALAAYRGERANRRFFWTVLCVAALVSVSGNALHAVIPHSAPLAPWLAAAIACVAPISLLATTHGLAILWRFKPQQPADERSDVRTTAMAIAAERVDKWDAVAAAIHEQGLLSSQPTAKISEVLRCLYDQQPPPSLRAIGLQVELHHDTVGKIREASTVVLGRAAAGGAP